MAGTDLRIALFSGNYNYVRDGANQALNSLMAYAIAAGANVRVYSPTTETPAFEHVGDLVSVPSWKMPGGRDEYRIGKGISAATRADLERFAPNIVQVSAPDLLGHLAARWARRNGIATIASLHTRFETYARYYHLGIIEPLLIRMQTRFYNRVDKVMVPSPSMKALLEDWGVKTPIGIWSRGIDHQRFNPARRDLTWRRSLGIADHEVALGFLGRLVLEKGLGIFADVVTELKRRGLPFRVLVVGDGPARDWFAEHVPDAVFAGFQSGDALARAVASMDVFFMPSTTETFGNVTTEAMASGLAVVAARATGSVDLVQEGVTGFLVPPTDVKAYADAIQRLIENPALRQSAGAAGHEAAKAYVWDRANQAMMDAYQALIAGCHA
jgi:glycosyltransferase involved in cell wall biosynthesis